MYGEQGLIEAEAKEPKETTTQAPTQTDVNAQTETQPVSPPAQPAPEPSTDAQPIRTVPLDVLLRTREEGAEKYRKAQAEAAHWRRQAEEHDRRQREAAAKRPDMFADPDAYEAWQDERFGQRVSEATQPLQQTISGLTLRNSALNARVNLGEDRWNQLNEWIAKQPPEWHDEIQTVQDPYGVAWNEYRQSTTFTRLGPKTLEEFVTEQVEAAKAKWLEEHAANGEGAQTAPANGAQTQTRATNGQFAPQQAPQPAQRRRSAPSLNEVEGASAPAKPTNAGLSASERMYGNR